MSLQHLQMLLLLLRHHRRFLLPLHFLFQMSMRCCWRPSSSEAAAAARRTAELEELVARDGRTNEEGGNTVNAADRPPIFSTAAYRSTAASLLLAERGHCDGEVEDGAGAGAGVGEANAQAPTAVKGKWRLRPIPLALQLPHLAAAAVRANQHHMLTLLLNIENHEFLTSSLFNGIGDDEEAYAEAKAAKRSPTGGGAEGTAATADAAPPAAAPKGESSAVTVRRLLPYPTEHRRLSEAILLAKGRLAADAARRIAEGMAADAAAKTAAAIARAAPAFAPSSSVPMAVPAAAAAEDTNGGKPHFVPMAQQQQHQQQQQSETSVDNRASTPPTAPAALGFVDLLMKARRGGTVAAASATDVADGSPAAAAPPKRSLRAIASRLVAVSSAAGALVGLKGNTPASVPEPSQQQAQGGKEGVPPPPPGHHHRTTGGGRGPLAAARAALGAVRFSAALIAATEQQPPAEGAAADGLLMPDDVGRPTVAAPTVGSASLHSSSLESAVLEFVASNVFGRLLFTADFAATVCNVASSFAPSSSLIAAKGSEGRGVDCGDKTKKSDGNVDAAVAIASAEAEEGFTLLHLLAKYPTPAVPGEGFDDEGSGSDEEGTEDDCDEEGNSGDGGDGDGDTDPNDAPPPKDRHLRQFLAHCAALQATNTGSLSPQEGDAAAALANITLFPTSFGPSAAAAILFPDPSGLTPLAVASLRGSLPIVQTLVGAYAALAKDGVGDGSATMTVRAACADALRVADSAAPLALSSYSPHDVWFDLHAQSAKIAAALKGGGEGCGGKEKGRGCDGVVGSTLPPHSTHDAKRLRLRARKANIIACLRLQETLSSSSATSAASPSPSRKRPLLRVPQSEPTAALASEAALPSLDNFDKKTLRAAAAMRERIEGRRASVVGFLRAMEPKKKNLNTKKKDVARATAVKGKK